MMTIRHEQPEDVPATHEVNRLAFGQPQEADLVDALRRNCTDLVSLVAVQGERVVGHILFGPAVLEGGRGPVEGMGLAPVAVRPEHQRQGIGSALIRAGIERLQERACPFVIVLGANTPARLGLTPTGIAVTLPPGVSWDPLDTVIALTVAR